MRLGSHVDRLLGATGYCHWLECVKCSGGVRMILDTDEHQQKQLYWTGSYEPRAVEVLAQHLPENGVFIDVGAGVGSICLFVVSKCLSYGKRIEAHAFEPLVLNYERLVRNAALNHLSESVHCHHMALAAEKGDLTLCFRNEVGAAAVLRSGANIHGLAGPMEERVRCDTLDGWMAGRGLGRLDVLKVDIEGAEPLLFRGAMQSIERFLPVILGEFNHWWAQRHGFSVAMDCFGPLWELGYVAFHLPSRHGPWVEVRGRPAPGAAMEDTLWIHPARTVPA